MIRINRSVRAYDDTVPQLVDVYWNLHADMFSVRAADGEHKGRVIAHRSHLVLQDVSFRVSEAGRQKVLAERRKNVHAVLHGLMLPIIEWEHEGSLPVPVRYNPYTCRLFEALLPAFGWAEVAGAALVYAETNEAGKARMSAFGLTSAHGS